MSFYEVCRIQMCFALGDCADTGVSNLTPVSANEARIAAKNLLAGKDDKEIIYPPIPSAVYTLPLVARVELLESEAKEKGLKFDVKFKKTEKWYFSIRVGEKYSGYKLLEEQNSIVLNWKAMPCPIAHMLAGLM